MHNTDSTVISELVRDDFVSSSQLEEDGRGRARSVLLEVSTLVLMGAKEWVDPQINVDARTGKRCGVFRCFDMVGWFGVGLWRFVVCVLVLCWLNIMLKVEK